MKTRKRVLGVLVAFVLVLGISAVIRECVANAAAKGSRKAAKRAFTSTAEAALKTPKLGKFKYNAKKTKKNWDAVFYTVRWKKVKGADGYQVQEWSRTPRCEGKYPWTKSSFHNVKTASYSYMMEGYTDIKVKVRAYRLKNGKKEYGKWSKASMLLS